MALRVIHRQNEKEGLPTYLYLIREPIQPLQQRTPKRALENRGARSRPDHQPELLAERVRAHRGGQAVLGRAQGHADELAGEDDALHDAGREGVQRFPETGSRAPPQEDDEVGQDADEEGGDRHRLVAFCSVGDSS